MNERNTICFLTNDNDAECVYLAMHGFSMRHIAEKTGYNAGQISYRLRMAEIKLSDYRHARNEAGQMASVQSITRKSKSKR